jgi:hypothetical protein
MSRYSFIIFFLFAGFNLFAQGEIDEQIKSSVRNERTFHLMLSTNGWGGGFSYARMKTVFLKQIINFQLVGIHDPKEFVISNSNGDRYAYGKTNSFVCLRNQYGWQKQLFSKRDKGGVEIRYYYLTGINFGFLKPIYYINANNQTVKFDAIKTSSGYIVKKAPFYKGLDEIKIIPGINFTIGSSFEYSKQDRAVKAIESGLIFDLFPKKIDLMGNEFNKAWFLGFFISFRFGKIINPRLKQ